MSHHTEDVRTILDAQGMRLVLHRMASEILERNGENADLAMVGIRSAGIHLARRLAEELSQAGSARVETGVIDVTLYRDDLSRGRRYPLVRKTEIPFDIEDRNIILVDDVLFTGRTTRAALDALIDFGRPAMVQLAVLIDRGHRELPISADYVGVRQQTKREESVIVYVSEMGQEDRVIVVGPDWVDSGENRKRYS